MASATSSIANVEPRVPDEDSLAGRTLYSDLVYREHALSQRVLADQWMPDPESGCLLRRDRPQSSPYRVVTRTQAAVDRLGSGAEPHSLACVEFEPTAGLWCVVAFGSEDASARWKEAVKSAFRLLADTGFGGRRSSGWGQTEPPQFEEGRWPSLLLPKLARTQNTANAESETARRIPDIGFFHSSRRPRGSKSIGLGAATRSSFAAEEWKAAPAPASRRSLSAWWRKAR